METHKFKLTGKWERKKQPTKIKEGKFSKKENNKILSVKIKILFNEKKNKRGNG